LVRIILLDNLDNEYLVFETYPLIVKVRSFNINNISEETYALNSVIPKSLRIEIIDANIYLDEISFSKTPMQNIIELANKNKISFDSIKLTTLRENISQNKLLWIAGETEISKLFYSEKKKLFGVRDSILNTQGFEFYRGGYFELKSNKKDSISSKSSSNLVENFDWRNRHGANNPSSPYYDGDPLGQGSGWITHLRISQQCNDCWIFGPLAATESMINLYFNQHIDYDLSEQHYLSCIYNPYGHCGGYDSYQSMNKLKNTGVVKEECFPYEGDDNISCSEICPHPNENISIEDFESFNYNKGEDSLKFWIINKGPHSSVVWSWGHVMALVGYGKVQEGDIIYNGNIQGGLETPIVVPPGSPHIGKTYWIFRNSWGVIFPYIIADIYEMRSRTYSIVTPITSHFYAEDDIACLDEDNDGYYNWGIGPKPYHCLTCPNEPDGDDSDPYSGPLDENGYCMLIPAKLPYNTGFENGLDNCWVTSSSTEYGRIQVTTNYNPHSGNKHLTLDVSDRNKWNENRANLFLNLEGETNVELSFWWKEFGDESHSQDGVYFSDDGGNNFCKVYSLIDNNGSWQEINLDVNQLANSCGLSLTSTFVIKFQQYDNYYITYDGFAFDDISISACNPPPQPGYIYGPYEHCTYDIAEYYILPVPGTTSYEWFVTPPARVFGSGTNVDVFSHMPGYYTLKVRAINSCGSSDWREREIYIEDCGYFMLVPNPADEYFDVIIYEDKLLALDNSSELERFEINVLTQKGILVTTHITKEKISRFNSGALPEGIYIVKINYKDHIFTKKLIIQH
jgi:hypothetical protein